MYTAIITMDWNGFVGDKYTTACDTYNYSTIYSTSVSGICTFSSEICKIHIALVDRCANTVYILIHMYSVHCTCPHGMSGRSRRWRRHMGLGDIPSVTTVPAAANWPLPNGRNVRYEHDEQDVIEHHAHRAHVAHRSHCAHIAHCVKSRHLSTSQNEMATLPTALRRCGKCVWGVMWTWENQWEWSQVSRVPPFHQWEGREVWRVTPASQW